MALTVLPDAAGGYTTLANFYLQSGKTRQARWYAQEALRREPTTDGYVLLASICRLLGNAADARHAMNEARKLGHQD